MVTQICKYCRSEFDGLHRCKAYYRAMRSRTMKGEGEASKFLITLLIFSGIALGMSAFYVDMSKQYGKTPTDVKSFNVTDRVLGNLTNIQKNIEAPKSSGIAVFDIFVLFLNSAISSLLILFQIPTILTTLIFDLVGALGGFPVPAWISTIVGGIVSIIIIMSILSIILKSRGI